MPTVLLGTKAGREAGCWTVVDAGADEGTEEADENEDTVASLKGSCGRTLEKKVLRLVWRKNVVSEKG